MEEHHKSISNDLSSVVKAHNKDNTTRVEVNDINSDRDRSVNHVDESISAQVDIYIC